MATSARTRFPHICIISPLHPSLNPRLVKEADALSGAGYDVSVIAADFSAWARRADAVFAGCAWRVVARPAFGPLSRRGDRIRELVRRVGARMLFRYAGVTTPAVVPFALQQFVSKTKV